MPSLIEPLIASRWFGYLARTALTFVFWASGLAKLIDFKAGVAEMAFFGLEPAPLVTMAVIVTQLGGSALVIANRWTWLGAGALAVFTALTIPIAHTFWTMQEPMKTLEFYVVMEHITVIGALMVAAWKSAPAREPAGTRTGLAGISA
ncbi:DoxX family protein [Rhizobium sp. Root483D2]|uniref:DoxX family protein n=1 Tax=Rhizobium sp. Root483D2 TaxID=1736545 RepID=UPI0007137F1F|nr:DoxX family protein [Rhizobium sp. Root483D2]KQY19427.1 DoxX family protein [Rhizobium sp. Root483D2]